MPPLLLISVLLGALFMLRPDQLILKAYVGGKPADLPGKPIGDFGCVLRADAADAWLEMKQDAALSGCILIPKGSHSAFRTSEQQGEMLAERPDFAAPLNHSPHQAGIAVDVDLSQEGDPLAWLQEFGAEYNWFPLSPSGAAKEPWHWEFHG